MKIEEFGKRAIRHGEVMLRPIDEIPADAEALPASKEVIVGHSESGHHHTAIGATATALQAFKPAQAGTSDLLLKVLEKSQLKHFKSFDVHETKELLPGNYAISIKEEYDVFAKRNAKVRD